MIDATIFLFALFTIFMFLALLFKDTYVFGFASFLSFILGLQLAINYIGTVNEWSFGVVGFGLILFSFWLLITSYNIALEGKKEKANSKAGA